MVACSTIRSDQQTTSKQGNIPEDQRSADSAFTFRDVIGRRWWRHAPKYRLASSPELPTFWVSEASHASLAADGRLGFGRVGRTVCDNCCALPERATLSSCKTGGNRQLQSWRPRGIDGKGCECIAWWRLFGEPNRGPACGFKESESVLVAPGLVSR